MFKRLVLFLATNLAVLALLSVVMAVFGVNPQSATGLILFAAVFGFGGSIISLLISKWMAKRATGAHVIEQPRNETERWLFETVQRQAKAAGIGMPEVAVYDAPEINAFATGANRNKALVAVSTGLLRAMDRDEAEAVLGHEVSHVANGDMVTMALLQGVLNTFVIVLSRVVGRVIDGFISGNREGGGGGIGYFVIVFVLDMVFGLFASMIAMWFSRHREFRADAGGATLAGRDKMVAALQRLSLTYGESTLPKQVAAFGISGGVGHGLRRLLMSHPPLEERIEALRNWQPIGEHRATERRDLSAPGLKRKGPARRALCFAAIADLLEVVIHVRAGGGQEVPLHVIHAAREQEGHADPASCTNSAIVFAPCSVARALNSLIFAWLSGFCASSWMKARSIFSIAGSKCCSSWNGVEARAELLQAHAATERCHRRSEGLRRLEVGEDLRLRQLQHQPLARHLVRLRAARR